MKTNYDFLSCSHHLWHHFFVRQATIPRHGWAAPRPRDTGQGVAHRWHHLATDFFASRTGSFWKMWKTHVYIYILYTYYIHIIYILYIIIYNIYYTYYNIYMCVYSSQKHSNIEKHPLVTGNSHVPPRPDCSAFQLPLPRLHVLQNGGWWSGVPSSAQPVRYLGVISWVL